MPTYQYHCTSCGRDLEIRQSFNDPTLTVCPECAGSLRKVFNAVGVVFKGSGFYKTDSRSGSSASIPAKAGDGASGAATSDGGSSDSGSAGGSTTSTPAPATAGAGAS